MLRKAIANETATGKIAKIMDAGNLVPDDVIVSMVKEVKKEDCRNGFLLMAFQEPFLKLMPWKSKYL